MVYDYGVNKYFSTIFFFCCRSHLRSAYWVELKQLFPSVNYEQKTTLASGLAQDLHVALLAHGH